MSLLPGKPTTTTAGSSENIASSQRPSVTPPALVTSSSRGSDIPETGDYVPTSSANTEPPLPTGSDPFAWPQNTTTVHSNPGEEAPFLGDDFVDWDMSELSRPLAVNEVDAALQPFDPNFNDVDFTFEATFQSYGIVGSLSSSEGNSSASLISRPSEGFRSSSAVFEEGVCVPLDDLETDEDDVSFEEHDSDDAVLVTSGKRKRGSLTPEDREDAARTRHLKACVRCRAQKIKVVSPSPCQSS